MQISQKDKDYLAELNASVCDAIEKRTQWLDSKMEQYAEVKIGEEICDLSNCVILGVVTEHYRYNAEHDKLNDRYLTIDYIYETSPRCIDNTSRHGFINIGSRGEMVKKMRRNVGIAEKAILFK